MTTQDKAIEYVKQYNKQLKNCLSLAILSQLTEYTEYLISQYKTDEEEVNE
jgi:hypothetical protein